MSSRTGGNRRFHSARSLESSLPGHIDEKEHAMKSQSGKSLIERVLQWLRGMWAESSKRRAGALEAGKTDGSAGAPPTGPASEEKATGDTGASKDEFATGGYTPDNPDLEDVEEAADGPPEQAQPDSSTNEPEPGQPGAGRDPDDASGSLVDQQMRQSTPPSGNYSVGNLGLGSRGSLGGSSAAAANAEASAVEPDQADEDGNESGMTEVTATASGGVPTPDDEAVSSGMDTDLGGPGLGGTSGAGGVSTSDDPTIRGIGDLGPEELGSLEELDEDAIAFEENASEEYDPNSSPGFAADVPDSLAEIDYETDDYTSSALADAGVRIVDEDDAGLTEREPGDDEFVDPGSVLVEDANDMDDARPLGDFTQTRSGIASESDEPTGTAGERSPEPFGSETGMATTETWTEEPSTEDLGETGELEAIDFGDTPAAGGADDEESPAPRESDIDVADLSYLDEAEALRYEFSDAAPEPSSAGGVDSTAGVADDIAASPTGVRDESGAVESDLTPEDEPKISTTQDLDDVPDSASGMADDIADSPTGDVDADATSNAIEDDRSSPVAARANIPNFATDKDSDPEPASGKTRDRGEQAATGAARSGPGDSVRGEESGSCPADFPIKGNSSSKIYHVPGIPSYEGTKAEWCFATEEHATGAGYRPPGQRNSGKGRPRSSGGRGR